MLWINVLAIALHVFAADFKTAHVTIGKQKIQVELAETMDQHQLGLMNRTKMAADTGMLFVFQDESIRSFWMKNTYIPLSIAFADKAGKILNILDMAPSAGVAQVNFPTYESAGPAKYALEMNQGWFQKKGVKPGEILKLEK